MTISTKCIIQLKSVNQLYEILDYLKERNILRERDFYFEYVPNTEFYELTNNKHSIVNTTNKHVVFHFVDGKHATYLQLLYG